MFDQPDPNNSDKVVDFHLPSLRAQARALAQLEPGRRIFGLVADEGTDEAKLLKSKGTELTTGPDQSVSALISRKLAEAILDAANPRMREWLFEDKSGSHRMLPIIHSAKQNIRTMSVSYD